MLAVVVAGDLSGSQLDSGGFIAFTVTFLRVYVSLCAGVSATTSSTTSAATISVLLLVVFAGIRDLVARGAWFLAHGPEMPIGSLSRLPLARLLLLSGSDAVSCRTGTRLPSTPGGRAGAVSGR